MTAGPKKMEILAPAGDGEALRAAVFSGAHAVYLGLKQFSARRTAGNFTPEELAGATAFCHARNVKVYVAVNTTLWPGELAAAADCVRAAAEAGADALIVQDLAAAALARRMAPGLLLHGSTQMSVHSPAGVRQLAAMGFSRVVLARELSLAEVRAIAQDSPIELEVFVHGALCMSVSGQCYMSAFLGGRSGNRGGCAGPCRLPFAADGSGAAHLSLKDLCAVASLPQLAGAGVASAKIEGRLRGPEYVAAAVHACGESLAGRPWDEALLRDVFSRSGFTNGYLAGRMDGSMFGVRTPEDTAASRAALPAVRGLYRRERQAVPVHFTAVCEAEGVKLTARDEAGNAAIVYGEETPLPAERDQRPAIQKALEKTGGTPFYAAGLQVEGEPGYLPGAVWNELRRAALEKLLQKREEPRPLPCAAPRLPAAAHHPCRAALPLWARFEAWEQAPAEWLPRLEGFILPIAEAERVPAALRQKAVLELPRAEFGAMEAAVQKQIGATREGGFRGYLAQNLAHFELAKGLPLYGGFGLNITNPLAAEEYRRLGLKALTVLPEVPLAEMEALEPGIPTWALVYGHMPLMMTRACPLHNVTDCARCEKQGVLTDRKRRKFPVRCGGGVRQIYNPVPLYMGERLGEVPADAGLALFTLETRAEAAKALELLAARAPWPGEFTRGLYYKPAP